MKQRFTLTDIKAITNELNERLSHTFIQNFYSTQQRFIYIKFSNKDTLLIEPGFRMHLTQNNDSEISHFCKKLREKCRHAKVQRIYQFGFDRIVVIDIQRVKIVIEFFSAGNMIIIDEDDVIIDILRPVPDLGMSRGNKYIFNYIDLDLTFERFKKEKSLADFLPFESEYLEIFKNKIENELKIDIEELKQEKYRDDVQRLLDEFRASIDQLGGYGLVTLSKGKPDQLFSFDRSDLKGKRVFVSEEENKSTNEKDDKGITENDDSLALGNNEDLTKDHSLTEVENSLKKLTFEYKITLKTKDEVESLISRNKGCNILQFNSMNEASEYFFSDSKKQKKEKEDKGTRIKKAQSRYIEELDIQSMSHRETAEILDENRAFVEDILAIFKKVFQNKMEWDAFESFWEEEKQRGNQHARAIVSFNLEDKKCIISLEDRHIEIDISKTLNKNIEDYYSKRKRAIEKSDKTKIALENIVEKMTPKRTVLPAQKREQYWFEKFNYFISSDNSLVIGGKNAQQNEIVVKKYMDPTDLYFHCDIQGASSVICKSRSESAIQEASYMSLCMSKCWDEGVLRQVFYVEPEQVSKSAPSGEYISKGSFMIKGKKNILNPHRLEYGVGILFKLDQAQKDQLDFEANPESGEKIVHAMPVSGPWICVKNYKYRVRICPGGEKKTKICQDIQNLFISQSEGSNEEMAVKSIGIDEYMAVVPGKSKIAKIV